jgi:hypothetical protein
MRYDETFDRFYYDMETLLIAYRETRKSFTSWYHYTIPYLEADLTEVDFELPECEEKYRNQSTDDLQFLQ